MNYFPYTEYKNIDLHRLQTQPFLPSDHAYTIDNLYENAIVGLILLSSRRRSYQTASYHTANCLVEPRNAIKLQICSHSLSDIFMIKAEIRKLPGKPS